MSGLFLSADELAELTGFKAPRFQARWLDKNRWHYAMARNAQPRVARAYFGERMGLRAHAQVSGAGLDASAEQPDFSAIRRR